MTVIFKQKLYFKNLLITTDLSWSIPGGHKFKNFCSRNFEGGDDLTVWVMEFAGNHSICIDNRYVHICLHSVLKSIKKWKNFCRNHYSYSKYFKDMILKNSANIYFLVQYFTIYRPLCVCSSGRNSVKMLEGF